MGWRIACVIGVLAAAGALGVGCGDSTPRGAAAAPVEPTSTPTAYLTRVEALLAPPARVASMIAAGSAGRGAPPVPRRELDAVVASAQKELDLLRSMRIDAPVIDRQRAALVAAYPAVIEAMRGVGPSLVAGDSPRIARAAPRFFSSVRSLSSAVSSPPR